MSPLNNQLFMGIFVNRKSAMDAINSLATQNFECAQISILSPEKFDDEVTPEMQKLLNNLSYSRYLDIPDLGNFLVAGPLAASLANWALQGHKTHIQDLFLELGFSQNQTLLYIDHLRNGENLLHLCTQKDSAKDIFKNHGAKHFSQTTQHLVDDSHSLLDMKDSQYQFRETYRPLI